MFNRDRDMRQVQHTNGKDKMLQHDLMMVKEKLYETKEAIAKTAYDAKHQASDLIHSSIDEAKMRGINLKDDAVNYVKDHPVKSLGFAMLAGLAIAQWFRSSK